MNRQRIFFLLSACLIVIGVGAIGALALTPASALTVGEWRDDQQLRLLPDACSGKAPNGLAQCGSQASSCKSCHEIKGEDPVNTEGDWHIAHAFGDFCEFCHGGNVQAVEKAAAHQGLVQPLGDVKANCASCHDDYEAKAQVYAVALGVTIGTGGASSSGAAESPSQPSNPSPVEPAAPPAAPLAGRGEIIDYAAQYEAAKAPPVSVGNIVVGTLLVLTVLGGGAFIYWNEKGLRRQAMPKLAAPVEAVSGSDNREAVRSAQVSAVGTEAPNTFSPDLEQLLPVLQSLDPRTLQALHVILSDRKRGEELIQSLSLINFTVLEEMKRLDKHELALLLALANET